MRINIRSKLAGALTVPLVALLAVAGLEVADASRLADEAADETDLATAALGPGSLINRIQDERNFTLIDLIGVHGSIELPIDSYEQARSAVDEAHASLQAFVDQRGGDVAAAFEGSLGIMDEVQALRSSIDASTLPRDLSNAAFAEQVYVAYADLIQVLLTDTAGIALDIDEADLRTGVELITLGNLSLEQNASIVRSIFSVSLAGQDPAVAQLHVAGLNSEYMATRGKIYDRSTGPYARVPETFFMTPRQRSIETAFQQFVNSGTSDLVALSSTMSSDEASADTQMIARVAEILQGEADQIVGDAERQRTTVLLLAALILGAAGLITVIASRSITNPLRSLTRQAHDMASDKLPRAVQEVLDTPLGEDVTVPDVDPITVRTRDEVADVAAALNTVQGSALDLAVEQAVLRKNIADSFINLGRRNQNLLDRQLEFITDLEREEDDAERLDGLFRLDHLATRMRRNAESLLRLAGGQAADAAIGWGGPVAMVDVIRGALGEVEDYQRVDVRALDTAVIAGAAAGDLAHTVAELVENALAFSPPHERVEIRGRRFPDGTYTIAVIDRGVGMTEDQLATANRRLAGQESFTVAPSRYLGHYVAGYLAASHGIHIELQSPAGGLTARIDVPADLMVDEQARDLAMA